MITREKEQIIKKLGAGERCVYNAIKKEECEVELIAKKCGCGMSNIEIKTAVQLLIYKNLIYWDKMVPRIK